jgi:hypothetical protein
MNITKENIEKFSESDLSNIEIEDLLKIINEYFNAKYTFFCSTCFNEFDFKDLKKRETEEYGTFLHCARKKCKSEEFLIKEEQE